MESAINLKLSSTQQHALAQDVTREEIKHAMFSLKNNKAPGPDGFNAGFFKRIWHIVGEDVINAVRSFFQTRRMLKEMNATSISLMKTQMRVKKTMILHLLAKESGLDQTGRGGM